MSDQNYQDPYAQQSAPTGQQWGSSTDNSNTYGAQGVSQYSASNETQSYGNGGGGEYPQAQTIFILGIVGIFVGICAFIAWYMGGKAKKEIAAGTAPGRFEGNLKTGYMLGKVFSIIYIVGTVLYIIMMIVAVIAAMSAGNS